MRGPIALILYCLFFSGLFVAFYSFISPENRERTSSRVDVNPVVRSGGSRLSLLDVADSAEKSSPFLGRLAILS